MRREKGVATQQHGGPTTCQFFIVFESQSVHGHSFPTGRAWLLALMITYLLMSALRYTTRGETYMCDVRNWF